MNNYYREKVKESGGERKKLWELITEISTNKPKISLLAREPQTLRGYKQMAEQFNTFFNSLGRKFASYIQFK